MLIFWKMVFILLLASLQCTRCISTTSVATSPTVTRHNESSTVPESVTQSNYTGLNKTTEQLSFPTEDTTLSFTSKIKISSSSEMSSPSEIPTTTSNDLTISESSADTMFTKPSETASNSFTTPTSDVSLTTMVSTSDVQTISVTAPPNSTTSAMPLTTSNNAKTVLTASEQTTRLSSSFTDSSAETHEPRKDNHSNGGVIFGAIVGAVLGCALIGLVGYLMCKKRKSEGFVHQRLYDDTRNDPVLRLDNTPEPYGESFADLSHYNPTTANEMTAQNSNTPPYDAIPMDDMTLSPHLP